MSFNAVCRAGGVVLIACLSLVACSGAESTAWRKAETADTPQAYGAYVDAYPQGKHAALAAARSKALTDQQDWQVARRTDSIDSLTVYLRLHPDGVWSGFARDRIKKLRVADLAAQAARSKPVEPALPVADAKPAQPPVAPPREAPAQPTVAEVPAGPQVQLGVFSTRKRANDVWQNASRKGGALADAKPLITSVRSGGKELYRLRAVLPAKASAATTCRKLVQAGVNCLPVPARKR